MVVVPLTPQQLAARLKRDAERLPHAVVLGIRAGAQRGRTLLVRRSPVYTGQFKNSWRVRSVPAGAVLSNDAPHAGIIECGARPHAVSRDGVEALREWVRRVMGGEVRLNLKEQGVKASRMVTRRAAGPGFTYRERVKSIDEAIEIIVWGIVRRLKAEGQKGLWIVKKHLDVMRGWLDIEVRRSVAAYFEGRP